MPSLRSDPASDEESCDGVVEADEDADERESLPDEVEGRAVSLGWGMGRFLLALGGGLGRGWAEVGEKRDGEITCWRGRGIGSETNGELLRTGK